MTKFFSLIFLWFFSLDMAAQLPENVRHLKVTRLNDTAIDVYVHHPDFKQKLPLLIFCQGSGYDSNTEGFLGLSTLFKDNAAGLAIEKQGVKWGDDASSLSAEYKEHNTVYNRLYDYLRVLQHLRHNADWWNGEVYIVGGSEGGLLAGLIASFYPDVKGLAILSFGGGMKFGEAWPVSSASQKKEEGGDLKAQQQASQQARDSLSYIRQHSSFTQSYSGEDNTFAWWSSIIDLRLSNALIDLNIPVFVGHGSRDIMAPPESARMLRQRFEEAGKKNLTLKEYAGYDHGFTDQEGNSHLVEVFMEAIQHILAK